jgi:hypothetical protein
VSLSFFHVAFLNAEPFEAMKAGTKRVEYRVRQRPDRTIEQLRPGHAIIFRLIGLTRGPSPTGPALLTTCVRCSRRKQNDGILYRIHVADARPITCTGSIVQGWRTRHGHFLQDHDHLLGAHVHLA